MFLMFIDASKSLSIVKPHISHWYILSGSFRLCFMFPHLSTDCVLGFMSYMAAKYFPDDLITQIDIFNHDSLSGSLLEKANKNMKELT